jgi:MFS family permease
MKEGQVLNRVRFHSFGKAWNHHDDEDWEDRVLEVIMDEEKGSNVKRIWENWIWEANQIRLVAGWDLRVEDLQRPRIYDLCSGPPVLQHEWDMSASQAGCIVSGFQLGYALSLVLFSSIADRISARKVYLGSLFAAAICSLSFAFLARDFLSGLILYTVVGIALGGTYTTGVMIIADQYVPTSRGMAVGFFIASTSCGYALSLAISGIALPVGGYRLSFFLTCLGPILGLLLAWITLRHTVVPSRRGASGKGSPRRS